MKEFQGKEGNQSRYFQFFPPDAHPLPNHLFSLVIPPESVAKLYNPVTHVRDGDMKTTQFGLNEVAQVFNGLSAKVGLGKVGDVIGEFL